MITVRKAAERGHTDLGWLDSRHSFSFGRYRDPAHMGFASLRVINEDIIVPGAGFDTHGHRDMEIVTYVLEGALRHEDSLGNGSVIRPGEVQRMSAGTGIRHSEYNASSSEPVHLLQIWILPEREGLAPGYEQKPAPAGNGGLAMIASREAREGALCIHQDVDIYAARLDEGDRAGHPLAKGRKAWAQVARGEVIANGARLAAGDGAAIAAVPRIDIAASDASELLLFDMG